MILKIPYISDPIEFKEGKIPVLIIENPKVLSNTILDFLSQKNGAEGETVFSENYKPLNFKKDIEIITDPFSVDLNSKKIINKTIEHLSSIAVTDCLEDTNKINSELEKYADDLIEKVNLPLEIPEILDISPFLKAMGICYDFKNLSLVEKLIEYIKLLTYLFDIKCFVILNLKEYLEKDELSKFYRELFLEKINCLIIEPSNKYILPEEKVTILDKDLCVL